MSRLVRPLDRYVFGEFWKIFVVTALGFPILLIVIDLTDHVDQYLNKKIPIQDIALSYVYWIPDSMFMVLPAAVLFATVFSIGALTRHAPRGRRAHPRKPGSGSSPRGRDLPAAAGRRRG